MDLASGYSDSINYGNGYTPLATGAINNNNADYLRNQMAMAMMAQAYNPYANSGGSFGAQPAAYAAQGAAYTGATGGGGNIYAPQQSVFETGAAPYNSYYSSPAGQAFLAETRGGGIGSDAVGAPNQPALTPQQYYTGGYNPYSPQTFAPAAQQNLGWGQPNVEAPRSVFDTGTSAFNPYASQPWWSTFERAAGPQGVTDWLRGQGIQTGGGYQPTGMSMQDRMATPQEFAWAPSGPQLGNRLGQVRAKAAEETSPVLNYPQYFGGHPVQFPMAPAYDPDPRVNTDNTDLGFGNDQHPLIGIENNNNYNRPDPNIRETWLNAS